MKKNKLGNLIKGQSIVKIKRERMNVPSINGVVIKASEKLLLVHCLVDFHWDGYCIVRLKDISEIQHDKYGVFLKGILIKEEIFYIKKKHPSIDVSDWFSVFNSLVSYKRNIVVEGECDDEFLIGKIEQVNKSSVDIRGFNALAEWDPKPTIAPYSEITNVSFDNEYIKGFSKIRSLIGKSVPRKRKPGRGSGKGSVLES